MTASEKAAGGPDGRGAQGAGEVVLKSPAGAITVVGVIITASPAPPHQAHTDVARATRFFWSVLLLATAASVAGNVTHAILKVGGGSLMVVAAAVAMVPPIVLLAATHSVGLLVRTRSSGLIYWCALSMTVALAGCAFALSFDSLWELAVTAGVRREIAWLWPLSIDVSIAQATLALLSLSRRNLHAQNESAADSAPTQAPAAPTQAPAAPTPRPAGPRHQEVASLSTHRRRPDPPGPPMAGVSATDWSDVAATLVHDGVTTKTVTEVVEALQLWELGTAPNTIARRLGLHRDTVTKITSAAADLMSAAKIGA